MQLDLRTLFIALATLYVCLGLVCLFLPYRLPGSRSVVYWGYGMLAQGAGFAGIALRGVAPHFVTVVLANALILVSFLFIMRSVRSGRWPRADVFGWSAASVSLLAFLYFNYLQPDTGARIAIVSLAAAILVMRPAIVLVAAYESRSRARIFTAICLVGVALVMLARAIMTVAWGVDQNFLAPDLVQFGSVILHGALMGLATLGMVSIEVEQLQAELERLAMYDPLTATLNRRAFMLEYEREVSRCTREKTGLALALFDLDRFKDVNDSHGHLVGDQVLRSVADRLRASLRGHDVLARYGGEEFALLMPGADAPAALAAAERARLAVGARPIEAGRLAIALTVSAGVAVYAVNGADWESLLRSADAALYEAKRGGRNRVFAAQGPAAART